jgi:indole-3-glycerol phosphate synthase
MNVLQEIVKNKREALGHTKSRVPLAELKTRISDTEKSRPFKAAITRKQNEPIKFIAELKKASPSEGRIRENFNIQEILSIYDKKPVHALSILTEEQYFQGSLDYLNQAKQRTQKPLLRKDFIFDEYQLYESRVNGADAVLLIVASLDKAQLVDLLGLSQELSLECLVEVHNLRELNTALYSQADIIGINNRDLKTLITSLDTTFNLVNDIPEGNVIVSESGIHTRKDVEAIESRRVDAILVGTTLMKAEDIGEKIDELMGYKS